MFKKINILKRSDFNPTLKLFHFLTDLDLVALELKTLLFCFNSFTVLKIGEWYHRENNKV